MMGLWYAAKELIKRSAFHLSVTSYLGPDNIWLGNPTGFTWQSDGYALVGYVVVRTSVDLRGHCGRSRSWNTAVWLATSIITGLSQAAASVFHYKPMMNRNLACLWLCNCVKNDPFIKMNLLTTMTAGGSAHRQISFHAESAHCWPDCTTVPVPQH